MSQFGFIIKHHQVVLGDRIRTSNHKKDWKEFKASFQTAMGQMQPIIVKPLDTKTEDGLPQFELIAGERRWRAIGELYAEGQKVTTLEEGTIWAATREQLPRRTQLLLEFSENEQREGFTFLDKARFIREFHEECIAEFGKDNWSQELTAHTLKLSPASISHYLRLEEAVKIDPAVAKATTLNAAVKRMKVSEKLKQRHDEVKKDDSNSYKRATAILHNGDAREWIKSIPDNSVDLINFDPPWGSEVSYKSQENHEGFDDSEEYAQSLMEALFPELFRVLKDDRFCVFWFRSWADESMAAMAQRFGFNLAFNRTACIWYKPDKVSDQNRDPERDLNEGYEKFFLLRKGNPLFHTRRPNNVFAYNRVPQSQVIHPTEKPSDLAADIIRLCTVPGELVLDPTAGSSVFLDTAIRTNRKATGCELSTTYWARGVTRLAEYLKTFKEG